MGRVRAGDKVLIECATGGVGTLAIQMAQKVGAQVVGLTTSPGKLGYIEDLGATAMTRENFYGDPNQKNFDFILNASGGPEINVQRDRLQFTGRIVCIGLSSGVKDGKRNPFRMGWAALRMPRVGLIDLMHRNTGVYGLNALKVLEDESWVRRLTAAVEGADLSWLKAHVGRVFAAEEVADAHAFIQTKQATGKVVLSWGD
jgi:NADPH:quinone reductase-like Zn-dependent oxidoreductase